MARRLRGATQRDPEFEETMTRKAVRKSPEPPPLEALNDKQAHYINAIKTNVLTFGIGPAGTGKTYIATAIAADYLTRRQVDRIIITRPIVDAGEQMGFLPGDMAEKIGPYMAPLINVLTKRCGAGAIDCMLKDGRIEQLPLAFMRGRSLENAFVILDEAQNVTKVQMKMFLTRMEEGCKIVVDGDPRQCDLQDIGHSGLMDAVYRLEHLKGIAVTTFHKEDVVRSGLVQQVVEAFEN